MIHFWNACCDFLRLHPCAAVLCSILCVILPAEGVLRSVLFLIPVILLWRFSGARKALTLGCLPALAAFLSLQTGSRDPLEELLNGKDAGAELCFTISDPAATGPSVPIRKPARLRCTVCQYRFSSAEPWKQISARVMLQLPREMISPAYGDRFRVRGILHLPEPPVIPESFDYGSYLSRRGIRYLFTPLETPVSEGNEESFYAGLLHRRDRLMKNLLSSMKNERERAFCAALLFGCRQGVNFSETREFLLSGTIHILTVSGLHVGMFSSLIFLLLSGFPLRTRLLLTPFLTLLYALSTGFQMPAFRAFAMLGTWAFLRAFLLRTNVLNTLLGVCSLFLLWNPEQVYDSGFQYSFICVGFLLASQPFFRDAFRLMTEKVHWVPWNMVSRGRFFRMNLFRRMFQGFCGCATAYLVTIGLTMHYQGICTPFAVAANLLILPFAWCCFAVFCTALIPVLLFPACGAFFASVLEIPAGMISFLLGLFGSGDGAGSGHPRMLFILLSLLLPACFFLAKNRRFRLVCAIFYSAVLIFLFLPFREQDPGVLLGDRTEPCLLLSFPEICGAYVFDVPDFDTAKSFADYLHRRGHRRISCLVVTSRRRTLLRGTLSLLRLMPADYLLIPRHGSKSLAEAAERLGTKVRFYDEFPGEEILPETKVKIFTENRGFSFAISKFRFRIYGVLQKEEGNTELFLRTASGMRRLRFPAVVEKRLTEWK